MEANIKEKYDENGNLVYLVTSSAAVGMSDGSGNLDKKFSELLKNVNTKVFTSNHKANKVIRKLFIDTTNYDGDISIEGLKILYITRNENGTWGIYFNNSLGQFVIAEWLRSEQPKQEFTKNGIYVYVEYNWENMSEGRLPDNNIGLTSEVFNKANDPRYAVTADKIVEGAVTADKIAEGAVTADKIAEGAVTADKVTTANGSTVEQYIPDNVEKFGGDYIEEYNEILAARVVTTTQDFIDSSDNVILKGYKAGYAGALEQDSHYNVLKVFVNNGDVIRQKLATYRKPPSETGQLYWITAFNRDTVGNTTKLLIFGEGSDSNYLDYRDNGFEVNPYWGYLYINIDNNYYTSDSIQQNNGLAADIITINKDKALTSYDNMAPATDYQGVNAGKYKIVKSDYRIERYENILGDIDLILQTIVGG